jgi:aldose 1-epimerase
MNPIDLASIQKHLLKSGHFELTLLPGFGCHWTNLRINTQGVWRDLLDPVQNYEELFQGKPSLGSYLMAPWANRIQYAAFEFEGKRYKLRNNFPDETAIHGDVRCRPWKVLEASEKKIEAVLDSRDFEDFNYPFALSFKHGIEVIENRIVVQFFITNLDARRAPAGFGFHPFLKRRLSEKDEDIKVMVPARKVYPQEKCIPTGPADAVWGRFDLRSDKLFGTPGLDHCYTQLTENKIRVVYPGTNVEIDFTLDSIFSHIVIYAPNKTDGVLCPRDFVAIEPQTLATNGFNARAAGWAGTGVKVLEPGEQWGGKWEMSAHFQ